VLSLLIELQTHSATLPLLLPSCSSTTTSSCNSSIAMLKQLPQLPHKAHLLLRMVVVMIRRMRHTSMQQQP
jgi:hypothetical protein